MQMIKFSRAASVNEQKISSSHLVPFVAQLVLCKTSECGFINTSVCLSVY